MTDRAVTVFPQCRARRVVGAAGAYSPWRRIGDGVMLGAVRRACTVFGTDAARWLPAMARRGRTGQRWRPGGVSPVVDLPRGGTGPDTRRRMGSARTIGATANGSRLLVVSKRQELERAAGVRSADGRGVRDSSICRRTATMQSPQTPTANSWPRTRSGIPAADGGRGSLGNVEAAIPAKPTPADLEKPPRRRRSRIIRPVSRPVAVQGARLDREVLLMVASIGAIASPSQGVSYYERRRLLREGRSRSSRRPAPGPARAPTRWGFPGRSIRTSSPRSWRAGCRTARNSVVEARTAKSSTVPAAT